MTHNILITGGGGDLAWSILRSLQASCYAFRFIGADCNADSVGGHFFDDFYLLPPASAGQYAMALEQLCSRERVQLIYPASDAELLILAELAPRLLERTGTRVITHAPAVVSLLRDKLETNRFLVGHRLPAPGTLEVDSVGQEQIAQFAGQLGWPLVIKPAVSRGSVGMHLVESLEDINFYRSKIHRPILQECIGPLETEHTCGAYIHGDGSVSVILLRRKLFGGVTAIAEKVESQEIAEYCSRVAESIGSRGPLNIQLRVGKKGPMLFEINPRLSSTACIRARFGFNDALWAFEETILGQTPLPEQSSESFCFRYFQECFFNSEERRLPKRLE